MEEKLLPCPFCGGEAEKMMSDDGFTSIGCLHCNPLWGVMVQHNVESIAVERWNTRAERTCHAVREDIHLLPSCSRCGSEGIVKGYSLGEDFDHRPIVCDYTVYDYCPNCGARVVQ